MTIKDVMLILILVIITNISIFSQDFLAYYKVINNAEIAALDENHLLSDSLYQIAFSLVEKPFKEDYYLAALNADKLNNSTKVYNYLKKGVRNGLVFKRIKKLENFTKSELYKSLKRDYKRLRNEHLQTLNIPLHKEIAGMIRKDQRARIPVLGNSRKWEKIDSYNYKRLLEIINGNGGKWPGFATIGEITPKGKYNVTDNIALMLLHFKKEEIELLKPYMLKAVLEGDMYPYHYARIIDYKSFTIFNKVEWCHPYGTYRDVTICDCEKAEIERKKIGLEPLKDYYRKINSTYTCKEN
jgi:hypothetical protein